MASKVNRSTVALSTRIDPDLDAKVRAFCDERGEGIREVVEMALRRHLQFPPPKTSIAPLPPLKPVKTKS